MYDGTPFTTSPIPPGLYNYLPALERSIDYDGSFVHSDLSQTVQADYTLGLVDGPD